MSLILGNEDLAKYPFLDEARTYIRETHFDLEEFNRSEFDYILERARIRVESELLIGNVFMDLEKYEIELFTFLVTLIMMKNMGIESAIKKYSLFEAMRVERFLTMDLAKERNLNKKNLLLSKIFIELFKLDVKFDSSHHNLFQIKISDYLARASLFHEQEWKLINRAVENGYVYLDADETVRLIRNELSKLIYLRIKDMDIQEIPEKIRIISNSIKDKISPTITFSHIINTPPPCIEFALDQLNRNENLPHSARVMLATYMLSVGKSIEDVIILFKNAPDFNEKITRYQVEHLAGKKGSLIKYSVPSCSKLSAKNLCHRTSACNGISNPLQFGKIIKNKKQYE